MAESDPWSFPPWMTAEQRQELEGRLKRLLQFIKREYVGNRVRYVWTEVRDGKATMVEWNPETPDEIARAAEFYDASHGLGEFARSVATGQPYSRSADELGLIAAIRARRSDDLPYLIYADYLTEHGDSQGDFIRLSVRLHRLSQDDPSWRPLQREWQLQKHAHAEEWFQPLTAMGLRPEYRRRGMAGQFFPDLWLSDLGVIDTVFIDRPKVLPDAADRLFTAAPLLRSLKFEYGHLEPFGLAGVEQLAQIEELDLDGSGLTRAGLMTLSRSPHLTQLKALKVASNSLDDVTVLQFLTSPLIPQLRSLNLRSNGLTARGARAIAGCPAVGQLEFLAIGGNPLSREGIAALCDSRHLTGLTRLDLSNFIPETDDGLSPVAAAGFANSLRELNLNCVTGTTAVANLLRASRLSALRTLSMFGTTLGAAGATALAASAIRDHIEALNLSSTGLGDDGLEALTGECFPSLVSLDLSSTRIGSRGLAAMAASNSFPQLRALKLSDNLIDAEALTALTQPEAFPRLTRLDLTRNAIGPAGAVRLAGSNGLNNLVALDVDAATVFDTGHAALIARFGESVVTLH